ncbi:MAG: hypothetical protein ABW168_05415, partial [Sedimenticola sp.]
RRLTRFTTNVPFMTSILTGKASPPKEIKQIIKKEMMRDFFGSFGFLDLVNYRSIVGFSARYTIHKLRCIFIK